MTNDKPAARRGRPQAHPGERAVRINITLSPRAIAVLDARGGGRSQEIERLILESEECDDTPPAARVHYTSDVYGDGYALIRDGESDWEAVCRSILRRVPGGQVARFDDAGRLQVLGRAERNGGTARPVLKQGTVWLGRGGVE